MDESKLDGFRYAVVFYGAKPLAFVAENIDQAEDIIENVTGIPQKQILKNNDHGWQFDESGVHVRLVQFLTNPHNVDERVEIIRITDICEECMTEPAAIYSRTRVYKPTYCKQCAVDYYGYDESRDS